MGLLPKHDSLRVQVSTAEIQTAPRRDPSLFFLPVPDADPAALLIARAWVDHRRSKSRPAVAVDLEVRLLDVVPHDLHEPDRRGGESVVHGEAFLFEISTE